VLFLMNKTHCSDSVNFKFVLQTLLECTFDCMIYYFFRKTKTKRVTRVELNKRARRKERLRAEAEAKKMENLSKEIDR
jgi:hypothetical protein